MDLDELRSVRRTEREKDSLQSLRDSFYEDVAAYLRDLTAQRDRAAEQAEDPFASDEVRQLTDRIEAAEDVSEAVYERRVGKVVKLASFAAAEMSVDEAGMTTQEQELFDDLVERIRRNKSAVLDILAGAAAPTTATETSSADATVAEADPAAASDASGATSNSPPPADRDVPPEPTSDAGADERAHENPPDDAEGALADAMGGEPSGDGAAEQATPARSDQSEGGHTPVDPDSAPPGTPQAEERDAGGATDPGSDRPDDPGDAGSSRPDTDRTTVRITRDVGQILGTDDREYDLSSEDVVTLPEANAEPLVRKDAAEKLE